MVFAVSLFDLIWMLALAKERLAYDAADLTRHVPEWRFYEEAFLAALLFFAASALLLNRWASSLVTLVLSGFTFYFVAIWSFWKLADNAEVPRFSSHHFLFWYPNLYRGQLLQIGLSAIIFCTAAAAIKWKRQQQT